MDGTGFGAMSVAMNRTAVILLASGLSRRYGRRDKLLANLAGKPLVEHAAGVLAGLDALAKVAVCPSDRPDIGEKLHDRFVIAVNKKPRHGLGHSIAVGVKVAMQFRPDAVLICMGDMPFIEEDLLRDLVASLGGEEAINIVHSGDADHTRPPTAFDEACFSSLQHLDGEDGARRVMKQVRYKNKGIAAPSPLLVDIDTKDDLALAEKQMDIRARHMAAG
jgi:molybdenum cofactor cytidylyltransferase